MSLSAPVVSNFKIAATAKMFQALSATTYQRPIEAVLREMSANILDAHLLNGFAGAGIVVLPTQQYPFAVFRDFGPGLCDEDILNLYGTFGASTKEQDLESIGSHGLGSKTPLAVADAFTVISRHNGERRIYTIAKDGDGIPTTLSDGKVYHDDVEHSGLEVIVPVAQKDVDVWLRNATRALRWFPRDKLVILRNDVQWEPVMPKVVTPRNPEAPFRLILTDYADDVSHHVLLGPVAYALDEASVREVLPNHLQLSRYGAYRLQLIAPKNSISTLPSREGLSYNAKTKETLRQLFEQVETHLIEEINARLDEVEAHTVKTGINRRSTVTDWKQAYQLSLFLDDTLKMRSLLESETADMWKGRSIYGWSGMFSKVPLTLNEWDPENPSRPTVISQIHTYRHRGRLVTGGETTGDIPASASTAFLLNDNDLSVSRVRQYILANEEHLHNKLRRVYHQLVTLDPQVWNHLGQPDLIGKTSELPHQPAEPERSRRARQSREGRPVIHEVTHTGDVTREMSINPLAHWNRDKPVYYLPVKRDDLECELSAEDTSMLYILRANFNVSQLYGLTSRAREYLEEHGFVIIHALDFMKDRLAEVKAKASKLHRGLASRDHYGSIKRHGDAVLGFYQEFDPDRAPKDLARFYQDFYQARDELSELPELPLFEAFVMENLITRKPNVAPFKNFDKRLKTLQAKYRAGIWAWGYLPLGRTERDHIDKDAIMDTLAKLKA